MSDKKGLVESEKVMISLSRKKVLILSSVLYVSLIGLISFPQLDIMDKETYYTLSVLRIIIGFICLAYLPGALMLRILKINKITGSEKLSYAVALSLSNIMIIGLIINIIFPYIGITKPLSLWPLIFTYSGVNLILSILDYYNRKHGLPEELNVVFKKRSYLPHGYMLLLPMLSIIGAKFVSIYNNSSILLLLVFLITIIPLMVIKDKFITESVYPFAIYMISLALLLHSTMVSPYPMRINVDGEYFNQLLVFKNEYWNYNLNSHSNTALAVIMIAPIFSKVLNVDTLQLFKLMYPIIFSLVPLTLYNTYSRNINKKYAFLSTLFLIFCAYYYFEAPLLKRQQISILYFSLILMLFVEHEIPLSKKRVLSTIFLISLCVSHYSTSFFCLVLFMIIYFIDLIMRSKIISVNLRTSLQKLKKSIDEINEKSDKRPNEYKISKNYIILFLVFIIGWTLYIGSGRIFNAVALLGESIYLDFFSVSDKSRAIPMAFGVGFFDIPIHAKLYRLLQYVSQLFIIIGSIKIIIHYEKYTKIYVQMIVSALIFLLIIIIAPNISLNINMYRIYFILLIILSPLCIIGGETLWGYFVQNLLGIIQHKDSIESRVNVANNLGNLKKQKFLEIFTLCFLIPYFLFNVGVVFKIGDYNEDPVSIPKSPSLNFNSNSGYYTIQEVTAAIKASKYLNESLPIYADKWIGYDLISSWNNNSKLISNVDIEKNSYLFLRKWNIISKEFKVPLEQKEKAIIKIDDRLLIKRHKMYDNGDVIIFGTDYD